MLRTHHRQKRVLQLRHGAGAVSALEVTTSP